MNSFSLIKKVVISTAIVAIFGTASIGSAMAQDGAERLRKFHNVASAPVSNVEQIADQAPLSSINDSQIEDSSANFGRLQKRHGGGIFKHNGGGLFKPNGR
ncbi:hypothetical protein [Halopseudomonas sp.]|jgi:hypothetical protein|uniref:hypothetical protein n=1 Tax=Halopseudomonas sp. TaxID=2901191 RepID=UPI003002BF2B